MVDSCTGMFGVGGRFCKTAISLASGQTHEQDSELLRDTRTLATTGFLNAKCKLYNYPAIVLVAA